MAFECPNCGGKMHYDIKFHNLSCTSCSSNVNINDYRLSNDAEERKDYDVMTYICKNCGAELVSPDESVVSYCSYCGSEQVLQGRMSKETRPKYIIPFKMDKEYCKTAYRDKMKGMLFVPSEMKDPQFLEKFSGVYVPYWMYGVNFQRMAMITGVETTRRGNQVTNKHKEMLVEPRGAYHGIPRDASSNFDDTIADDIEPFHRKNMDEFTTAYLAGFYANRADVNPHTYDQAVEKEAAINAYDMIQREVQRREHIDMSIPSDEEKVTEIRPTANEVYATLLPVWFLTWRKKDRVAYAVVNGETGKLVTDTPIDKGKFALFVIALAAILFVALGLAIPFVASTGLAISLLVSCVTMLMFYFEAQSIRDRENHVFDEGYFATNSETSMSMEQRRVFAKRKDKKEQKVKAPKPKLISPGVVIGAIVYFGISFFATVFSVIVSGIGAYSVSFIGLITAIMATFFGVKTLLALRYVKNKFMMLVTFLEWASCIVGVLVINYNPVGDVPYYAASALCAVASLLACLGMIQYYDYISTRPMPTFFDRKGGNDGAK